MNNFIITDPCYIMNEKDYDKICSLYNSWEKAAKKVGIIINSNALRPFESLEFPFESTYKKTRKKIIFHHIKETPHGDGSCEYEEQEIGVDAGMLCIAECEDGWNEQMGATFNLLSDAKRAFPGILSQF